MFEVSADAYDRFMGVYSSQLAPQLADLAGVEHGQRALDVGCGPGALTAELVERLSADDVAAVDPSAAFVAAARERRPSVRIERASADALPFPDESFDATLAQLVVHFMAEPVASLAEMARVTRRGGTVAASVWDHAGYRGPLATFWAAVRELDPTAPDESDLPGTRGGHLVELFEAAGLGDVQGVELAAQMTYTSVEQWWEPYMLGVGPAGAYATGLDEVRRAELRERCRRLLPTPPFTISAVAWAARGVV